MYMRAELQRELDFGIPAQEEAHRYARWCAEETRREAAQAESTEASGNNYAKADMVVHPKRLSTDLGAMNIDFSNLGEDVSGLDVFSRVEAALGKKVEEKRKEKREKKESAREKLKATLLASPKRENSFNSLDEPSMGAGEFAKEKKGSRFLRKVISDRVIKPKGGAEGNRDTGPATDDARSREIADFFGKMAAQPVPGQPMGSPLPPRNTPSTGKSHPTMERSKSDIPASPRKEASPLPSGNVPEGRRPSHPEFRTPLPQGAHTNGRPPSKSEPPPPPQPPKPASHSQSQDHGRAPPPIKGIASLSPSQTPSIRAVYGSAATPGATRPNTQPHEEQHKNNNDSVLRSKRRELSSTHAPPHHEEGDKRRPSLPASHTYQSRPPSSTNPQFQQNEPTSTFRRHDPSSRDRQPSPDRSKPLKSPPLPPPQSPPQSPKHAPASSKPQPQATKQEIAVDDLFSRIEQDIARNHPPPPVKEKGGDERARDKGRKLFGKALDHIKHGGDKVKEKIEKERR